ncbi:hypothetical protein CYMTET_28396 [Cymbomonas tetramitiformis]|uniref:Dynein axonemal assembly factor 5 TPR repeats domain-containing protein n=1 Tax=Cymbomonas tetramitiformis TaxID=36881 RepID=A0AAE0FN09_9CHLO|nr:hypothetical protein CYMTET_28396 [Cymbomonas tetramitiformis]
MGSPVTDRDSYVASVQRDINCLSDNDRNTRKRALDKLNKGMFGKSAPSPEVLQEVFCRNVLPPAARLLSDTVEKNRELTVALLRSAAESLTDVAPLLPLIFPVMVQRLGNVPVLEDSEEIRLQLVDLIGGPILKRCAAPAILTVLPDIVSILVRSFADSFHEIVKKAATTTVSLTESLPPGDFPGQRSRSLPPRSPPPRQQKTQCTFTPPVHRAGSVAGPPWHARLDTSWLGARLGVALAAIEVADLSERVRGRFPTGDIGEVRAEMLLKAITPSLSHRHSAVISLDLWRFVA